MFVEDWGYRMIREYTTSGVVIRSPLVTFPSGPAGPVGLSLDGAGNIFCGDGNAGVVRKYTTARATVNNLFITGVGHPYEVLCDGSGRLYVADAQNCRVGVYDTTTGAALNASLIQWTSSPMAMTLDDSGYLFVGFADNTIREYDAATGTPLASPLISGLNSPRGLAYDGNGHLFVGNWDGGTVGKYTTSGETINAALISGLVNVTDLAFDAYGHLFVADWRTGRISEYTAAGQVINPNVLTLSSHISSLVIVVPEPSVMSLALLAGVLLLGRRHRTRIPI